MSEVEQYQVSCVIPGQEYNNYEDRYEVWFRGTYEECEEWMGDGDIGHLAYPDDAFLTIEPVDDAPLTHPH